MAELPPDQNNNPHLRAQLKRDRDANERFQASQQEMSVKAARIQSQARRARSPEPETKTRRYTNRDTEYGFEVNNPGFGVVPGGDRIRSRNFDGVNFEGELNIRHDIIRDVQGIPHDNGQRKTDFWGAGTGPYDARRQEYERAYAVKYAADMEKWFFS